MFRVMGFLSSHTSHTHKPLERAGMNEHPFRALIDLVTFDQAFLSFTNKKESLEKQIDHLQHQALENDRILDQMKQHAYELQKNVDMQELELKALDDQERAKKVQLDSVNSL